MTLSPSTWGDHLCDLSTPQVRLYISEFGAKAGILRFLSEHDPELRPHILDGHHIAAHNMTHNVFGDAPMGLGDKLLYRSTNPADAFGFVGQLPTLSGTTGSHGATLSQVRGILNNTTMKDHHLGDDPNLVQKTGVYIQPKIDCIFRGSVVEHPHFPGKFLISYSSTNFGEDIHDTALDMHLFDENGLDTNENLDSTGLHREQIPYFQKLVKFYKKIQRNQVFEDGISFQMEFGIARNNWYPYIFQVRQFRPFDPVPKNIRAPRGLNTVFGITPEEGILLQAQIVHGRDVGCGYLSNIIGSRTNALIIPFLRKNIDPESLKDLSFVALGGNSRPNLEHHIYDAALKVQYVLMNPFDLPPPIQRIYVPTPGEDDQHDLLYFSDGSRGNFGSPDKMVMPTDSSKKVLFKRKTI